jgi:hypothetical protein
LAASQSQILQLRVGIDHEISAIHRLVVEGDTEGGASPACSSKRRWRGSSFLETARMNETNVPLDRVLLANRTVQLDDDGELWTGHMDTRRRETLRDVYTKLCETGEDGRQLVAVHQELLRRLDALILSRRRPHQG